MSYSSDLKHQLAGKEIKRNCCRKAILFGMLAMRGQRKDGSLTISLESSSTAPLFVDILKSTFGVTTKMSRFGKEGSRARIDFMSQPLAEYIDAGELTYPQKNPPCPHCQTHFMRGIFLASGCMADFKKLYRMEFYPKTRVDGLFSLLAETVGEPKVTVRRGETVFYYKTNATICDILALIGAEADAFALINDTIMAGYRNAANRRANCEARNIEKSVEASMRFVGIIRRLMAVDKLSALPHELQMTAKLRAENPTVSLAALGARCTPPVSKSGMNHRLEKIEARAKEILAGCEEEGEEE